MDADWRRENIFHLSESKIGLLSRLYSVGESAQHVISEKETDVILTKTGKTVQKCPYKGKEVINMI